MVKVGVIGCGYMGNYHIRKCNDRDDLEVIAVYDIDQDKCTETVRNYPDNQIQQYKTLEEFLSEETIEVVFVCTPNDSHKELAIACLQAGKHVMNEKPVTLSCQELDEVIAVAEKNQKLFTVHQNRRWDPDFLVVQEMIRSKKIGKITNIFSCVQGQRGVCFGWRADPSAGGGMLYDWGIHLIDQILQLFPDHEVVSLYARMLSVLTPAVDDYFELKLTFDHQVCATILVTTFSLQERPRWFIYGDRGTLKLDDFSGKKGGAARIKSDIPGFDSVFSKAPMGPSRTMSPLQPEYIEKLPLPVIRENFHEYHRNLAEACKGTEELYVTHRDMRRAMMIVESAFLSAKNNVVIKKTI